MGGGRERGLSWARSALGGGGRGPRDLGAVLGFLLLSGGGGGLLESAKVPRGRTVCIGDSDRGRARREDLQVGRASLLGLIVIGAGDAEGDAMLAGSLRIVRIVARAPHLTRTARIAACSRRQRSNKGRGRGERTL